MFEKFSKKTAKNDAPSKGQDLTQTSAFLACVVDNGFRLTYGALAAAARILGEDTSGQIPAQRGGGLVLNLPAELQPYVCRANGRYAKGAAAKWPEGTPSLKELQGMDVIQRTADRSDWKANEIIAAAVQEWQASLEDDDSGE